jgi:plasmid stabilization system protein ParE
MKIVWSDVSISDLENIHVYISHDSPFLADSFVSRLVLSTDGISDFSKIGRVSPEFNSENIREIIVQNYRIIYHIFPDFIYILTVYHAARNLKDDERFFYLSNP